MAEKFKYTDYQLESWDYVVLVVYFVSILLVGIWVCTYHSGSENRKRSNLAIILLNKMLLIGTF